MGAFGAFAGGAAGSTCSTALVGTWYISCVLYPRLLSSTQGCYMQHKEYSVIPPWRAAAVSHLLLVRARNKVGFATCDQGRAPHRLGLRLRHRGPFAVAACAGVIDFYAARVRCVFFFLMTALVKQKQKFSPYRTRQRIFFGVEMWYILWCERCLRLNPQRFVGANERYVIVLVFSGWLTCRTTCWRNLYRTCG